MAEITRDTRIDRGRWRRALRHLLRNDQPGLRVVAEGFRTEASELDLLAVGERGEWVSVRIAAPGRDQQTLTQTLADLAWLVARTRDLLKLAPDLGVEADAPPRAMIFASELSAETVSAARMLPPGLVTLRRALPFEQQGRLALLGIDAEDARDHTVSAHRGGPPDDLASPQRGAPPTHPAAARLGGPPRAPESPRREARAASATRPRPGPGNAGRRLTDPPSPSRFRTGLTDADLELGAAPARDESSEA